MAAPPRVIYPKVRLMAHEQEVLDGPFGLMCACCGRPGTWSRQKPLDVGGEHLVTHPLRGFPCVVPKLDPEVARAVEKALQEALARQGASLDLSALVPALQETPVLRAAPEAPTEAPGH